MNFFFHINVKAFFSGYYPAHNKPDIAATNYLASVGVEIPFRTSCLLICLSVSTHTFALSSLV